MGRRLIDPRAVRANIERMHAENPDASVVIQPDRRSFNDTLVQVMDASREAGVYDISIAADSDTGGAQCKPCSLLFCSSFLPLAIQRPGYRQRSHIRFLCSEL
jgi:hypothetical protein